MRKSDKKLENKLREVLTEVCETALKRFDGFEWLTHETNYKNFPNSLRITCVFDTNTNLDLFRASSASTELSRLIQKKLFEIDVNLTSMAKHLSYDTEENCKHSHDGNWAMRLA